MRFALLAALSVGLIPAMTQVEPSGPEKPKPLQSTKKRVEKSHPDKIQRNRHHSQKEFRKLMQAELRHIPTLNRRVRRFMIIQGDRNDLRKKRQAVAVETGQDREVIIKKFHRLLKRDQELSNEARNIVRSIADDMPQIQKELDNRRDEIKRHLKKAGQNADTGTSSSQTHDFRRRLRYMNFLEKKLGDLKTHPERLDLLVRVLRGFPFDDKPRWEREKSSSKTTTTRMKELHRKRRILQRQLRQVQNRIDELGVPDKPTNKP